ncbi:hypothetical protein [Kitasatospora sp. DSM 101779]|uniref:hypothetical protein n=1 Tax=Kitasatospora sp. DSM 101779 TaxID=2853165 RepID=UPI0021D97132|nr:hypothetical protein [Kitasatospora sp. DSM 101779]MCU7827268.1 hypothetical protein [Kitasatospora sp. DSM 101779]
MRPDRPSCRRTAQTHDRGRDGTLTNYPVFDERLLALYEGLRHAGYDEQQLQAFCRLFTAIGRIGLMMTWSKQYKRGVRVSEPKYPSPSNRTKVHGTTHPVRRSGRGTPVDPVHRGHEP